MRRNYRPLCKKKWRMASKISSKMRKWAASCSITTRLGTLCCKSNFGMFSKWLKEQRPIMHKGNPHKFILPDEHRHKISCKSARHMPSRAWVQIGLSWQCCWCQKLPWDRGGGGRGGRGVVVMANKNQNGGTAPFRCEDEESSESEKAHLESMSLIPLTIPVSTKKWFHMLPGPRCSENQLYQEDGGKGLLGQHPGIEYLPCEPAWLSTHPTPKLTCTPPSDSGSVKAVQDPKYWCICPWMLGHDDQFLAGLHSW